MFNFQPLKSYIANDINGLMAATNGSSDYQIMVLGF